MRTVRPSAAQAAPAVAAVALLLVLVGHLAAPSALLVVRDVLTFHLPLRATAAELTLQHGLPEWNPLISGGQPILSNPNYAWFYPPSWLAVTLPAAYSLSLLVIAHAALALAGAWRLLRQLGAEPDAAGLGAMGYSGSAWFLSLAHTFNFFCGMAWFPWVLAATDYTLTDTDLRVRSGPFRWRVPLHEIRSIAPTHNPLSSPALSLDRLRIEHGERKWLMISPRDKDGFLRELESRRAALRR